MDLDKPFVMDADQQEEGARALHMRSDARTICHIFRSIHLTANNPAVTHLCIEGVYMAKHMDKRLRHYRRDWDNGLWMPASTEATG